MIHNLFISNPISTIYKINPESAHFFPSLLHPSWSFKPPSSLTQNAPNNLPSHFHSPPTSNHFFSSTKVSLLKCKWNHITPLFKILNRLPIALGIQSNPTDLALDYLSNPIPHHSPSLHWCSFCPPTLQAYCCLRAYCLLFSAWYSLSQDF